MAQDIDLPSLLLPPGQQPPAERLPSHRRKAQATLASLLVEVSDFAAELRVYGYAANSPERRAYDALAGRLRKAFFAFQKDLKQ